MAHMKCLITQDDSEWIDTVIICANKSIAHYATLLKFKP